MIEAPAWPLGPGDAVASIGARGESDLDSHVEARSIGGLQWTIRADFARVLEATSADAWSDPAGQGWERVKQNGARTVWRARIDGRDYYLKYYAHQGWIGAFKSLIRGPECAIEFDSGIYALRAGIRAVRPVGYTGRVECEGRPSSLLVTEAIRPAYPLNEYWATLQADDNPGRRRRDAHGLIDDLAEMIARAHQYGFRHSDMHAANILVHAVAPGKHRTVFVDLQSARRGAPLSDRAVVRNLSQLNQWFRRNSGIGDRLRFLRRYLRWRDEYEQACPSARPLGMRFDQLVRALIDNAERHAERLYAKRDRRVRRSNRYFARIRIGGGWRGSVFLQCKRPSEESRFSTMVLERDWWRSQLKNPVGWFDSGGAPLCKRSHSALVARGSLAGADGDLPVIVKRPLPRNGWRRLRQFVGSSRSLRGWRIGNALLNRAIATARPLAVLERRRGPLVFDSVLLTEAIPGGVDLEAYVRREFEARSAANWRRHRRELTELLARFLRQLGDSGFVHRDCKAQNILVVAGPRPKLLWIDMDGLKPARRPSRAHVLRALTRLHVSLLDVAGLTRSDRLRFLKIYFARFGTDARAWRAAWSKISRASADKLRAQAVRREWKLKHYGRT